MKKLYPWGWVLKIGLLKLVAGSTRGVSWWSSLFCGIKYKFHWGNFPDDSIWIARFKLANFIIQEKILGILGLGLIMGLVAEYFLFPLSLLDPLLLQEWLTIFVESFRRNWKPAHRTRRVGFLHQCLTLKQFSCFSLMKKSETFVVLFWTYYTLIFLHFGSNRSKNYRLIFFFQGLGAQLVVFGKVFGPFLVLLHSLDSWCS